MSVTHYYLLRLRCGCEFKVAEHVVRGSDKHRCTLHGTTTLKFSRPWSDADGGWEPVTGDATGRLPPRPEPKKPDHRPGEERKRSPREEARILVEEVFNVREQREALEEQIKLLRSKQAKLVEEERRLVECLAEDHGLYSNPDR